MATLARCEELLDDFHRFVAPLPGVQGVGIGGSGDACVLLLYLSGDQPSDSQYPEKFPVDCNAAGVDAVDVEIRTVGNIGLLKPK